MRTIYHPKKKAIAKPDLTERDLWLGDNTKENKLLQSNIF